jgi:hypothetical protein
LVAICVHGCDELHGIVLRERVEDDARFELRMAHGAAAVDVELSEALAKHGQAEGFTAFARSHQLAKGLKVDLLVAAALGLGLTEQARRRVGLFVPRTDRLVPGSQ